MPYRNLATKTAFIFSIFGSVTSLAAGESCRLVFSDGAKTEVGQSLGDSGKLEKKSEVKSSGFVNHINLYDYFAADALKESKPEPYTALAVRFLESLKARQDEILRRESLLKATPNARRLVHLLSMHDAGFEKDFHAFRENSKMLTQEMSSARPDPEMIQMLKEEQVRIANEVARNLKTIQREFTDLAGISGDEAIIEIHGSEVGTSSPKDVDRLYGMYVRYAESKGWKVESLSEEVVNGDVSSVTISVKGRDAFTLLRAEKGGHRFIEPGVSNSLKRTRYAQVQVYPPMPKSLFSVDPADIVYSYTRSSGPGGQHVNKTDTAVHAVHKPSGVYVKVGTLRSQHENKVQAEKLLMAKLFEKFQVEQNAATKSMRQQSKLNEDVAQENHRWTRTYDWTLNRLAMDKMMDGNIEQVINQNFGLTLQHKMRKLVEGIETGSLIRE